jgi:uncharacterized protein YxeA
MKKLLVLALILVSLLSSCSKSKRFSNYKKAQDSYEQLEAEKERVKEMTIVYSDLDVEIRTYKLDGHDRIMTLSIEGGVSDNHSETCKKCYEDPYN